MNPAQFLNEAERIGVSIKSLPARDEFDRKMGICSGCRHRNFGECQARTIPDGFNFIPTNIYNGETCPTGLHTIATPHHLPENTKPKLVIMTPSLFMGGAEFWIMALCRWLPYDITVIDTTSSSQADPTVKKTIEQNAKVLFWWSDFNAADQAMAAADVCVMWGIPHVSKYTQHLNPFAPCVWVLHGGCEWTKKLADEAAPNADVLVGVSDSVRRVLEPEHSPRMLVLHNGVDIERTIPVAGRKIFRHRWHLLETDFAVGYIGRLSPEKRPLAPVEACFPMEENFKALVIGDGWKAAETQEEAREKWSRRLAPDYYEFTGFMPHVGDALASLDVWINASPSEGFCLSLIEAWLAGTPVISTPTGAVDELEKQFGKLVHRVEIGCSSQDLSRAVYSVRLHRMKTKATAQRAREMAWNHFTAAAMAYRWERLLSDVMTKRPIAETSFRSRTRLGLPSDVPVESTSEGIS